MIETHPASDDSAVSENPKNPQIPERAMTSQTALTGVLVQGCIFFHHLDPGSALSRANANTTRDASTPWAAPVTYCTTMIRLQIASIPRLPSTFRKSWPIGSGRSVPRSCETEAVAKEAAMNSSQPSDAVAPTPTSIAMGAARAALAVSSDICAAESSGRVQQPVRPCCIVENLHPVNVHMGEVNARRKAQPPRQG